MSWITVIVQFACLGWIFAKAPWIARPDARLVLQIASVALGVWATFSMRASRVRILPTPAEDARLITTGPYRWIRHPMYTSVLGLSLSMVASQSSWTPWAAWMLLLVDLVVKLSLEERLLERRFAEYATYRRHSWRLLPPLF